MSETAPVDAAYTAHIQIDHRSHIVIVVGSSMAWDASLRHRAAERAWVSYVCVMLEVPPANISAI